MIKVQIRSDVGSETTFVPKLNPAAVNALVTPPVTPLVAIAVANQNGGPGELKVTNQEVQFSNTTVGESSGMLL